MKAALPPDSLHAIGHPVRRGRGSRMRLCELLFVGLLAPLI